MNAPKLGVADAIEARLKKAPVRTAARVGHVTAVTGPVIRAALPDARVGEVVQIEGRGDDGQPEATALEAEVIGFDKDGAILMPLGPTAGITHRAAVRPTGRPLRVPTGEAVRGRVLDALGRPADDGGPLVVPADDWRPLDGPPPEAMGRRRVTETIPTGVRCIDGVLTLGLGQRVGVFAAAGTGKSTLLGQIARHIDCDSVVLALIGERGREVRSFIEDNLGDGLGRSTVIVSTSDQPALLRLKAAHTATAIAEAARARGENVVLMMDSVTRFARALREVGLAAGEPPGRQGYPSSVFAELPRLFERAGSDDVGTMTALYTVLVAGDEIEEPVADEAMSLLDGHVVLSRKLAARGHYPAVDITQSVSRLFGELDLSPLHRQASALVREAVALYEENYDKIALGLYEPPSQREQQLLAALPAVQAILRQGGDDPTQLAGTVERMAAVFGMGQQASETEAA